MRRQIFLCLLAALGSVASDHGVFAESPQEVFKRASPSVVLVRDAHGLGSGVVLDQKGLIVTNFHVVSLPLPLEVTAIMATGGKTEQMTFKDVKIVGVHPSYDLALLQVPSTDASFFPAKIGRKEAIETGETCYASR